MEHQGDWLMALPWYAEGLHVATEAGERVALHRERLTAILDRSPKLLHVWWHQG
jgi:hypothetical protein